jgi:membrane-anchored mycosin MYCP
MIGPSRPAVLASVGTVSGQWWRRVRATGGRPTRAAAALTAITLAGVLGWPAVAATAAPGGALSTTEAAACPKLTAGSADASTPWAQTKLGLAGARQFATGAGITVGVVDTGVSAANPQLRDAVVGGRDLVQDGIAATVDCDGHGTLAAGIIAARPAAGAGLVGIAPDAEIRSYRWTDGGEASRIAPMAAAIRAAVDDGVQVVSISSVTNANYRPLAEAVAYAEAHDVVVVAAAGNDGAQGNAVTYPAGYPGVIAVAAVGSDGAWWKNSESSVAISVAAPGVDVTGPAPISGATTADGTSFATPFVAGLAALVRSAYPDLTAAQVKRRIEVTADDPAGTLPDKRLGWGTINPVAALTDVVPGETSKPVIGKSTSAMPALSPPAPPDTRRRDIGVAVAGSTLGLGALVAGSWISISRARTRQPSR